MIEVHNSKKWIGLKSTLIRPGYRHSSKKSLRISTEEYHPENGEAGNCNPPTSAINQDTPGTENHCKPRPLIAGKLICEKNSLIEYNINSYGLFYYLK